MRLGPAMLVAGRALFGRKVEGEGRGGHNYLKGAVFGVALALVPLVVVLVVADGMIEGITARYMETATYHLQASPLVRRPPAALEEDAAALAKAPGLVAAYAEIQGPAVMLGPDSRTAGALLRAVEPRFLEDPGAQRYLRNVSGELRLDKGNEILLGEALARSLGAAPGDIVSVVTAREGGGEGGALFSPKVTPFRVRGVLSTGYRELDSLWALLPLRSGARIMSPATSRSFVGVKAEKPFGPLETERRAVKEALLDGRGGEAWSVSTWAEAERNLFKSFATTRALLLLVMALAVAVAAVNVGSALVMLVLERRRDLAILKSAGASPGQLGLIFILAGLATGGAGSLLGIGLGSLLAWRVNDLISGFEGLANLAARALAALQGRPFSGELRLLDPAYYLERVPVRLDPGELLLVLLSSLLLCLLASILPARRAARLPPLEIFRKT
ncbi:MAG TPA: FtsX-like permease family protein [Spirochaetia bacterium]|nr:FtsX-like permease family protein [Spirochaetia bacterium]